MVQPLAEWIMALRQVATHLKSAPAEKLPERL